MNLYKDLKTFSKIDRAVIEVNGGCNYSCEMCPQSTGREKGFLKKMPLNQFKDIVTECVEHGATVINLEGSGEPTLNRNLPEYIRVVKEAGAKAYIFSNGLKTSGEFMKDIVDAGVDFYRFSIIGYDPLAYAKWMNSNKFYKVVDNLYSMREYAKGTDSRIASYHLILDNNNVEYELQQYKKIANGGLTEIWKMHNWSGEYTEGYTRKGTKRTCGRPFSPDIVVRAGGNDGHTAAVHPCCQVLGNDSAAVLGHLDTHSIDEVLNGQDYNSLREGHLKGEYPDFCRDCDFLLEDPEVLVYSNHATVNKMHGTSFSLEDFKT